MKLIQIIYLTVLVAASAATSATRVRAVAAQESWVCISTPAVCVSHPISNCPIGLVSYRVTWTCWMCCFDQA
ncbi:hypothetical protein BDR03DRAFT_964479 [Suillus americanus]|nr:hypothetical protein BDR03DRAFT_964479 [Suillus americanus]